MTKIAYVSSNYNWSSYSIVRSFYEVTKEFIKTDKFHKVFDCAEREGYDYIFAVGADSKIINKNGRSKIIGFGFSDPNLFNKNKAESCDMYFTNDYNTAIKNGYEYLPCFADIKYFKKTKIKKNNQILFVGVGDHPFIKDRREIVNKLREYGIKIKIFGNGWGLHEDNNAFITGDKLIEEINQSSIMVDLSNEVTSIGSRIFQAAACGVPTITNERDDILSLFIKNEEILTYNNVNELIYKLKTHNNISLSIIGNKARKRILSQHLAEHRIMEVIFKLGRKYADECVLVS